MALITVQTGTSQRVNVYRKGSKGDSGDSFTFDTWGTFSERDDHDGEAVGFLYYAHDVGYLYMRDGLPGNWIQVSFGTLAEIVAARDAASTSEANAQSSEVASALSASEAEYARSQAVIAATAALANMGVDSDFISWDDTLPNSTDAVVGTRGAYFMDNEFYQVVEWDGGDWVAMGIPLLTIAGAKVSNIQGLVNRYTYLDGQTVKVLGFYEEADGGGGLFYWDATEDKANHDGGLIIDPTHSIAPGDSGWYSDENVGSGCWKRVVEDTIYPEHFGDNVQATFTAAAAQELNISFSRDKTYTDNFATVNFTSTTVINFNNANFVATIPRNIMFQLGIAGGDLHLNNFRGICDNLVARPVQITSNSVDSSVYVNGYYAEEVYRDTGVVVSAAGLFIVGEGKQVKVDNYHINKVDCAVGETPTAGIHIGYGAVSFENVWLNNLYFYNVTEQGGSERYDSDSVKVYGSPGTTGRTHVYINNVKDVRDGVWGKRTIKTQTQTFDINNVETRISGGEMHSVVDPQYGIGSVKNIRIEAVNSYVGRIVEGPYFSNASRFNEGYCSISNVYAKGDSDSSILCPFSLDIQTEVVEFVWTLENVVIGGFDASSPVTFVRSAATSNKTTYIFRNINCSEWVTPSESFSAGRDSIGTNIYKANAIFENVVFPEPITINGRWGDSQQCYTQLIPIKCIGSNLFIEDSPSNQDLRHFIQRYPEMRSGVYYWSHSLESDTISTDARTVLHIPSGLDIRRSIEMYVAVGSNHEWNIWELFITYNGATVNTHSRDVTDPGTNVLLDTPTASWDAGDNELTISWSNVTTSSMGWLVEIKSGSLYYEVVRVMTRAVTA